ncbi:MAG: DegT/DnrJ/EryC1/StrS family aminotransferase [Candidatus Omnitrophica bacterium]|nr:DegT/DnrJ/EryC1/StrS family aminotransferase [Candidatus Omnitrophota bacterium]
MSKNSLKVPFVDLKTQYQDLRSELEPRLKKTIEDCHFILGESVNSFEKEFADYCGTEYAVSTSSGTAALFLALSSLGIGKGDEVITAANTFIATVLAIHYTGARPVLVDVEENTYNLDINKVKKAINKKTRAIVPVHLYGQPVDMQPLLKLAKRYRLKIVEDACQAHGAEYKGRKTGTFGDVSAFSFYPGKNLGAYGDGGMVVTNSARIKDKMLMLRDYGQKRKYQHLIKGFNARLDTIQAEILRVKLSHLDRWNESRRLSAKKYNFLLNNLDGYVITPSQIPEVKHVWHLYVIRTKKRDVLQRYLKENGIFTGIHYPIPIHLQPAFSDLGYKKGEFPVTEKVAGEILSLPMYPELRDEQIEYVVKKIEGCL